LALVEAKATRTIRPEAAEAMARLKKAVSGYLVEAYLVHLPASTGPSFSAIRPGIRALTSHGISGMILK
jgi:L-lysine 2,3-aminomutase